jgi:hypothetical protein
MNVDTFILSSQKLSTGAHVVPFGSLRRSSKRCIVSVTNSACSCLQTRSVSWVVHALHARIDNPLEAEERCATPLPYKPQFDNCLNCLLLQVDTCVYLDAPILHVLHHARVEVTPVGIDVLPFCGIKQFPNVGQVVAAVDPRETH